MSVEEKADVKCTSCKCYHYPSDFLNSKGRTLKTCQKCRDYDKINREKNKCPHGRKKNLCKECDGVSICSHGRRRNQCKDCGGASICEHNTQRSKCKECGGSQICEHNRQRNQCKDCGGASICPHGRLRNQCKDCGGAYICEHNRIRSHCKECMNAEQKIEFIQKKMIRNSRHSDKEKDRYDADNFIDKCFLEGLFEDSQNCHYCDVEFTYNQRCDTFVTIERLNNTIGHIKSNCVLACFHCNNRHNSKDE